MSDTSNQDNDDRFDWDRYEQEVNADSGQDTASSTVLVDSQGAQRPHRTSLAALRNAERRPLVPAWLRSRSELSEAGKWLAGFVGHTTAYHLLRIPKYAGKLIGRSPRGAFRIVSGACRCVQGGQANV